MTYLFTETKVAYLISAFSGIIPILFIPVSLVPTIMLVVAWVALNVAAFAFIAWRKFMKINKLHDDCDVENFLALTQELEKRDVDKTSRTTVLLNLSTGYLMIGDNVTAGHLLYDIGSKRFPKTQNGARQEFVYHNNGFAYCKNANDIPGAAQALERMGSILQNRKLPKSVRGTCHDFYLKQQCILNIANGNYDGAEELFIAACENDARLIDKVAAKYTLGKIYLHQGRQAEAALAFEYVIEHGGSTIFRMRAVERLEALGRHVCLPPTQMPPVKVFSAAEKAALAFYCGLVVCVALFALVNALAGL